MEDLFDKTSERLQAEIIHETDTPHTRDLKVLRAKRLAYYGRTKTVCSSTGNTPSSKSSGAEGLHSVVNIKEKDQTSPSNSPQQLNDATNGKKLLIQKSSGICQEEQQATITEPEMQRKCMGQNCILELDHRLLEDVSVPETQKLKHVVSWAQLFLSNTHEEDNALKNSRSSQGLIFSHGKEIEIVPDSKRKETSSSDSFFFELGDGIDFSAHGNTCKSSSLHAVSEHVDNLEGAEECTSPDLLRESTLSTENKCYSNICISREIETITMDMRARRDPAISQSGQLAVAYQTHNSKDKYFQNNSKTAMSSEILCIQPHPFDSCSSKTVNVLHENTATCFWLPLSDSSDEECTDRIVKTREPSKCYAEIEGHKNPTCSILPPKGEKIKHLGSDVLEGSNTFLRRKNDSSGKWTKGEKCVLKNQERDNQKDFILVLKAENFKESKVITDHFQEQAGKSCNLSSTESQKRKDDLEELMLNFTFLKRERDQRDQPTSEHEEGGDRTFEVRKHVGEEQTNSIFSGASSVKNTDMACKREQTKIELKLSRKDQAMQNSNHFLNLLANSPETPPYFKVCPDCASLNYPHVNCCNRCDCALLTGLIQSREDNMEPKCKMTRGNVMNEQNRCFFNPVIKSEQVLESSSEVSPKTSKNSDDGKEFCWEDEPLLNSDCDIGVLDKYYFYLNYLNKTRSLHPREGQESFPFQELNGFSKEQRFAKCLKSKVVEQKETEETNSDCRDFELNCVSSDCKYSELNRNADAIEQEKSQVEELKMLERESASESDSPSTIKEKKNSQVLIDKKLSETKSIRMEVTGSKRHWEKSSIAWSSYSHGELKSSSHCIQRPVSAGVGKKRVSDLSQSIQLSEGFIRYRQTKTHPSPQPEKSQHKPSNQATTVTFVKTINAWTNYKKPCKSTLQDSEGALHWDTDSDSNLSMWQLLPDELWLCIFSFLSQKELSQVAQVCHRFHCLARDESFWGQIHIVDCHCLNDEWLIRLGLHHPQCFSLYHCHDETWRITEEGLKQFFQHCKESLKELNTTSCSGPTLRGDIILYHASTFCNKLTSVDISWTGATDLGIIALAEASVSLQSLSANGCQITDDAVNALIEKHGKRLSKIEVFGCHALTAKSLSSIAEECPNLQTLNIGRVPEVTHVCLSNIVKHLKKLSALNVTGLSVVRDHVVHFIVTQCPKLESLILSSCSQVTDLSLVEISTYLQTIRYLDVSSCKKVTDIGVQALAGSCHQLYYLDLSSTGTSKRGVCLLASFCHSSLECVKLNFCKNITLDAVKKLCKKCKRLKMLHLYGCCFSRDWESIKEISKTIKVFHDLSAPAINILVE
ncbi:uncharacterized protein LOC106722119 [Alligator sinensis]|uniref:Uncharacterized protein LOC106722119 n=1 Tax=Alligator sinensis TaxID=38654 RepID=A0A3Q0GJB3_ALLSI|nr:uncharacterized protein LOC106722119 [Alligator sinensis]